jgi:hypothetical protein
MALAMVLRRMGEAGFTVHGFRSAFRDWCGEETSFPREICEAALAHSLRDKTEAAYRRGDALERRRRLMEAWVAQAFRKAGVKAARGRNPQVTARTVRGWCEKIAEDVGRHSEAAKAFEPLDFARLPIHPPR